MTETSSQELRRRLASFSKVHLLGPMPGPPLPDQWDAPLVLVDGGGRFYKGGAQQVFWVGDGDSLAPELPKQDIPSLEYPEKKDLSDLKAALDLLPETCMEVQLWGFLGGKRDHELANFGEIHRFLKSRTSAKASFHDAHGLVEARAAGRWEINLKGRFSLLALESCQVRMFGDCEFPIDPPRMLSPLSSLGISNQGKGMVHVHSGGPFFILA